MLKRPVPTAQREPQPAECFRARPNELLEAKLQRYRSEAFTAALTAHFENAVRKALLRNKEQVIGDKGTVNGRG